MLGGGWDLYVDGRERAQIGFSIRGDGDFNAAGARAMAAELQSYAKKLRSLAAELDRRNVA